MKIGENCQLGDLPLSAVFRVIFPGSKWENELWMRDPQIPYKIRNVRIENGIAIEQEDHGWRDDFGPINIMPTFQLVVLVAFLAN